MTHIAERGLLQDATAWVVAPDGAGGDTFSAPVAVKCRWEDRAEKFVGPLDRDEHISMAVVYVDRNLAVGDYLFQGVSVAANPSLVAGAYKIRRFDKTPDLRNLLVLRKAYL
jgi:hypothetical protein